MVLGLVQRNYFVPTRRFREDGREASQLATGEGGVRRNILRAPALAKQTKPGDPLQVQVEPVVLYNRTVQIVEATRSMHRRKQYGILLFLMAGNIARAV